MNNYNSGHPNNSDLEANFIQNNDYQASQGDRYGHPQSNLQQGVAPTDFRNNLNYSIKFNLFLLLISVGKIIASTIILTTAIDCIGAREGWVIIMIVHDALYSLSLLTTIGLVRKINSEIIRIQTQISSRGRSNSRNNLVGSTPVRCQEAQSNRDQQVPEVSRQRSLTDPNQGQPSDQATYIQQQELRNTNLQIEILAREIARRQRLISKMTNSAEMLYIILFILGQFLLFLNKPSECKSQEISNLMLIYIILGYLWLLSPIILILLACLCLPVLIFCLFIFGGRGSQVAANRDLINNLPVKNFTNELSGDHECAICMTEYQEGDKIIQFKCSPMHHFHEDCIKRWLEVNGQCPICRARIEEMNFQAENAT